MEFELIHNEIKNSVLYFSAIPLPDVHGKGMLKDVNKETCAGLLIAELFLMMQNWKTPKCPSINKYTVLYIHKLYSVLKRMTRSPCKSQKHMLTSTSGYNAVVRANHLGS